VLIPWWDNGLIEVSFSIYVYLRSCLLIILFNSKLICVLIRIDLSIHARWPIKLSPFIQFLSCLKLNYLRTNDERRRCKNMQTYRRKLKLNVGDTNCNNAHTCSLEHLQLTFSIYFLSLPLAISDWTHGHIKYNLYIYIYIYISFISTEIYKTYGNKIK